jgi:DNA polymerase/3'-5' exonuclease PolX
VPAENGPPAAAKGPAANNEPVAQALEQIAELFTAQAANPLRCGAYREAARVVRSLPRPVGEMWQAEGRDALERLPKIGRSLARTIDQLAHFGTTPLQRRLRG